MAGQQTPQELAASMIPGLPAVNFLSHLLPAPQAQGDPRVAQAQAVQMRRQRLGFGIQQQRAQMGQRPLQNSELEAEINRQLMPTHLRPGVPTAP